MTRYGGKKLSLLRLLQILEKETEESAQLTTNEIIEKLDVCYGISIDRKTLYEHIELLCYAGYDIVKNRGRTNSYFCASKDFELPELKVLIDTVQASKLLTKEQSRTLVNKLARCGGKNSGGLLRRDIVLLDVKHTNNKVFYYIDTIFGAMHAGKKVSFLYYDYVLKNKISLHKDERYTVDPIRLIHKNDNYYLAAYSPGEGVIKNFRVDRMGDVKEENLPRDDSDIIKKFDLQSYLRETFQMFGGELVSVKMSAQEDILKSIIDQFGQDIAYVFKDDGTVEFVAGVQISPTFFAWCATFKAKLTILSPDAVREEYKDFLLEAQKNYYQC